MLTPGGTLGGRYRLDERIATGGMGDVWKAEDTVLGRVVAVKILQSALLDEPGFIERFRAEARVMATINHPGVVRVYDYGESGVDGGGRVAYLVMEYVEGEALSHTLSRVGRLTPERAMNLLAQAGEALEAAHEHGIVHRDVKPGNLLVRPDGKLVLTDFGIARSAMSGQLTTAGSILGTASYVSPEQATGAGNITSASDVYSLGVVGYQCLSGHRPFEGENPIQVAMKHVRDIPPPLPADVPAGVRGVIDRAMSKDAAQRWPSASAMAEASRRAASGHPPTSAFGTSTRMSGPQRTSVLPAGAAVAPTSGPGTGNYHRGAAAVPSAPPYGGRPAHEGYTTQTPPPRKSNGLMVAGVVVAVIVVLAGLGGIGYAMFSGGKDNPGKGSHQADSSASQQSQSQSQSQNDDTNKINLQDYAGKPYRDVANDLENRGARVRRAVWQGKSKWHPGLVVKVKLPEGRNPPQQGDEAVVYVQPGNEGNGNNNGNGGDQLPTLPGVGGKSKTPSEPPSTEPSQTPSSDGGTSSPGATGGVKSQSFTGGSGTPLGMGMTAPGAAR